MGNIVIGYDNLIDDPAVTITHSTEAGSFVAENVKVPDLADVFRSSVLNPAFLEFDLGGLTAETTRPDFQLFAILGSNATNHRNLLKSGNALTSGWTPTELQVTIDRAVTAFPSGVSRLVAHAIQASGLNPVTPRIQQTWTKPTSTATQLTLWCYMKRKLANANARMRLIAGSNFAEIILNLTSNTEQSSQASGFTGLATSVTDAGNGWIKVALTVTTDTAASVIVSLSVLDSAFAVTYNHSGEAVYVINVQLVRGAATLGVASAEADYADTSALVRFMAHTSSTWITPGLDSTHRHFAQADNLRFWPRTTGGAFWLASAPAVYNLARIEVFDPNNADGHLDIGRVFIGSAFQPSRYTFDQFGRRPDTKGIHLPRSSGSDARVIEDRAPRSWEPIRIPFTTEAEADEVAQEMFFKTRGFTKPVVVILDPDETSRVVMMYGWIDSLDGAWAYGDSAGARFYNLSFSLRESRS